MTPSIMTLQFDLDSEKKQAALKATEYVQDGMVVGLGTGTTSKHLIIALGERVRSGLKIQAVPTSHDAYRLRAEMELLRPLFMVLEASFEGNRRERSSRTEDLLTLSAGATYAVTRNLRLEAQYGYTLGTSNFSGNFDRSRVSLGVTTTY